MKIICLDYDGTYTVFTELLDMIVDFSLKKGYKVILATMRYESEEDEGLRFIKNKGVEIIYTNRQAKLPYLASIGVLPDLWIDDNPHWLFTNE